MVRRHNACDVIDCQEVEIVLSATDAAATVRGKHLSLKTLVLVALVLSSASRVVGLPLIILSFLSFSLLLRGKTTQVGAHAGHSASTAFCLALPASSSARSFHWCPA